MIVSVVKRVLILAGLVSRVFRSVRVRVDGWMGLFCLVVCGMWDGDIVDR